MKRTSSRPLLGFLLIGVVLAISAQTNLAQTCTSTPAQGGRVCSKPGAPCSPVTEGVGDKGNCTTEGSRADVRSCECKGAAPPSYNIALAPLTPQTISGPSGPDPSTATSTITVTAFNGFTGTVFFTCSVAGGGPPLPSCPNPSPVTVTSGPVNSTLSVSAVDATPAATYTITVTAADSTGLPSNSGAQSSSVYVGHLQWTVGGGGGIALLTLAGLLALWSMGYLVRGKRADLR